MLAEWIVINQDTEAYQRSYHPYEGDTDDDGWPLACSQRSGCLTRIAKKYVAQPTEPAALRARVAELEQRLAEYRLVNEQATATIERYLARFGPLS